MKNIKPGMIVENKLPNNKGVIVCRVIGFIESVGQWRLVNVSDDKGRSDEWLIEHNLTWACPEENIHYHDADCIYCHKNGLVSMG